MRVDLIFFLASHGQRWRRKEGYELRTLGMGMKCMSLLWQQQLQSTKELWNIAAAAKYSIFDQISA